MAIKLKKLIMNICNWSSRKQIIKIFLHRTLSEIKGGSLKRQYFQLIGPVNQKEIKKKRKTCTNIQHNDSAHDPRRAVTLNTEEVGLVITNMSTDNLAIVLPTRSMKRNIARAKARKLRLKQAGTGSNGKSTGVPSETGVIRTSSEVVEVTLGPMMIVAPAKALIVPALFSVTTLEDALRETPEQHYTAEPRKAHSDNETGACAPLEVSPNPSCRSTKRRLMDEHLLYAANIGMGSDLNGLQKCTGQQSKHRQASTTGHWSEEAENRRRRSVRAVSLTIEEVVTARPCPVMFPPTSSPSGHCPQDASNGGSDSPSSDDEGAAVAPNNNKHQVPLQVIEEQETGIQSDVTLTGLQEVIDGKNIQALNATLEEAISAAFRRSSTGGDDHG
jgi:hypothetical protein